MNIILAADTSTSINTVAVCRGEATLPDGAPLDAVHFQVLAETAVECHRLHSERLLATVDWVLDEAGIALDAIDLLAVSIGPGSFTGLRIGAAAWKGLAFALKKPLVAVPTLDALSRLAETYAGMVCPLLDARMKEVFAAAYRYDGGGRTKTIGDTVCPIECFLDELAPLIEGLPAAPLFLGDGANLYRDRIMAWRPEARFATGLVQGPRAAAVAAEGLMRLAAGDPGDAAAISPVYLRLSQAEQLRASKAAIA
jgi:tRNA threonylcarbamoyladenosine biosynthesis protein TsaB